MCASVKVSIIIPMYCCEGYVTSLLDNICGQDFQDTEILCVVDGSPDNTFALVSEYSEKDPRVRPFEQDHKNAGAARNLGLIKVRGEYVIFADADDEFAPDYVSKLLQAVEKNNADMAVCQFVSEDHYVGSKNRFCGYKCVLKPKNRPISTVSIRNIISDISSHPFNKIIRRDLITSNDISFSETNSINDVFFFAAALVCADSIVLIDDHLVTYKYMQQSDSISASRGKYPEDTFTVFRQLYEWIRERGLPERYISDYCKKWSGTTRYYSAYCKGEEYAELKAHELASEDPWKNMSDRELRQKAMLRCGFTKRRLKKNRKKLRSGGLLPEQREYMTNQCRLDAREIRTYSSIIRILNDKYGRSIKGMDNYLTMRIAQTRQEGIKGTIQIIYRKILNLRV